MTETFYNHIAALQEHGQEYSATRTRDSEYQTTTTTDLQRWVIDCLELHPGDRILDIGCDKQTLPLAHIVGPRGYVLALDRSYEALNMLSARSLEVGLETRIRFLHINLDDLDGHLRKDDFERVLSSRALYHMRQPRLVFNAIYQALTPGGFFFFYGPSRRDHAEMKQFHATVRGDLSTHSSMEMTFLEEVGLPYAREFFSQVEVVKFEQPLCFDSPDALYLCWSTSKLYNADIDTAFRQAAMLHFQSHTSFETMKRVVGIRARK